MQRMDGHSSVILKVCPNSWKKRQSTFLTVLEMSVYLGMSTLSITLKSGIMTEYSTDRDRLALLNISLKVIALAMTLARHNQKIPFHVLH